MPIPHLLVTGSFTQVSWRVVVGETEVIAVPHQAVIAARPSFRYSPNDFFLPLLVPVGEQRPHAKVFGVAKKHFVVLSSPGDAGGLAPPRNTCPEVNAFFYAAFFTLVPFDLKKKQ